MANILTLTSRNFYRYGRIIEYPGRDRKGNVRNLWRIVHRESARVGWRIAYLVLRDRAVKRMECHPDSDETFEPICGRAVIFVARVPQVDAIKAFYLDRPIMVRKGIWHAVVRIEEDVDIKITENAQVACRYWDLGCRMDIHNWATLGKKR